MEKITRRRFNRLAAMSVLGTSVALLPRKASAFSVTYFGECDSSGTQPGGLSHQPAGWTVWNSGRKFACPGSGNQDVQDLSVWIDFATSGIHVRVAVYSDDGSTLMAQGSSAVAVSALGWQGHLSAGAITQSSPLVGGTNYRLIASSDGNAEWYYVVTGSANDNQFVNALDETAGYPGTAPSGTDFGAHLVIRCGVQPSGGGGGSAKRPFFFLP